MACFTAPRANISIFPSHMLKKRLLQKVTQVKNLPLIGDFNAPNVNWNDITSSCHDSTLDARIFSFCLDNFPVQHFYAGHSVGSWSKGELPWSCIHKNVREQSHHRVIVITYRYALITCVFLVETQEKRENATFGKAILKARRSAFKIGTRY